MNIYSVLSAYAKKLCKHRCQENHDQISPCPSQLETHHFYKAQNISLLSLGGKNELIRQHKIPLKACERGFCHVMAFEFSVESSKIDGFHFGFFPVFPSDPEDFEEKARD